MEDREMLKKILDISEQNNKMLKKLHRAMWVKSVFSFIYWLLIIGAAVGAYYYIQTYLDQILEIYSGGASSIGDFLKQIK